MKAVWRRWMQRMIARTLKYYTTRQEGGAAFMAAACSDATGKPGVCFVTRGPGVTNASIGVHTAQQGSTPLILLIGQIPRAHRDREAFQEVDYRRYLFHPGRSDRPSPLWPVHGKIDPA